MNLLLQGSRMARLSGCCVIATLTASAMPAVAQDQGTIQTVVVTGSRIRQNPLNEQAPVVTVTAEDIAKTGLTSVADILQRMPVSGGGLNG